MNCNGRVMRCFIPSANGMRPIIVNVAGIQDIAMVMIPHARCLSVPSKHLATVSLAMVPLTVDSSVDRVVFLKSMSWLSESMIPPVTQSLPTPNKYSATLINTLAL